MKKLTISHEFRITPEVFWEKVFFNPEYNEVLYRDELKMPEYKVLESREEGSTVRRRVHVMPKQDAPAAVQKFVNNAFSYIEEGTFDRTMRRYRFRVVPSTMADKFRAEGEVRAEAVGSDRMRRVLDMTLEVSVFGLGGIIEGFIAKSMEDNYAKAAEFTNRWISSGKL